MHNYIFFDSNDEIDKSLYRIFSVERLLEMFSEKALVLVKPKKWDDPFENFILKSKATLTNGDVAEMSFANHLFGQCWSQHRENDAMWRIYSQNKNGVKVRSTSRKLLEVLAESTDFESTSAFIGKVKYEKQSQLEAMVADRVRMNRKIFDTSGRGHAETLLFKRREFSHEKEVRLIYSDVNNQIAKDKYSFYIDPFDLIEEIIFDPRMDTELSKIYISHFKNLGFQGHIKKSTLYELPNLKICV